VVYERTEGASWAPLPPAYRPRHPESTALYRIVAEHLETFLAEPVAHGAAPYPRYVERELRRFLTCGVPAHGFYRVRCSACGYERLLGLSCAGRLCPSCWARRTADGAAHLVDRFLPSAPYRQLVLSLPYKLRIYLARDPRFLSAILGGYLKCVFAWQRHRGRVAGIEDGHSGAVTFVQRFGGALNLNVHFHNITPDGLFVPNSAGTLSFVPLEPPSNEEVARLGRRVFRRLTKIATRYLDQRQDEYTDPDDERATLLHALSVALRPPVRPQRALPLGGPEQSEHRPLQQDLCTAAGGFSLHVARTVEAHDREGLEGLCRYGLRAPFSQRRLSVLPNGKVRYELARPWPTPTGVTELIMEPVQLLKRLAVLLPAPYQNLTRYHGVFARCCEEVQHAAVVHNKKRAWRSHAQLTAVDFAPCFLCLRRPPPQAPKTMTPKRAPTAAAPISSATRHSPDSRPTFPWESPARRSIRAVTSARRQPRAPPLSPAPRMTQCRTRPRSDPEGCPGRAC
jgi:hypothetical protein